MKTRFFTILILFASLVSCNHEKNELAHHHDSAEGAGMQDEIVLQPNMAERFGVKTDTAATGEFYEIIEAAGKIETSAQGASVVAAPVSGVVHFASGIEPGKEVSAGTAVATVSPAKVAGGDPNKAALASLNAAKAEVERLRPLHESGIVSTRDWNEAQATLEQARAAYSAGASSGRASAATSGVITALSVTEGAYVNAGEPIAEISSQQKLVLRADVPERLYPQLADVTTAKVKMPYTDRIIDLSALSGRRISTPGDAVAGTPGYVPVYFSFHNDGSALAGGFVQVYLQGAPRSGVISLPVEAISEQQGNFYVYQRLDAECYRKLAVTTGESDGERVEITSGVTPGMEIVTSGTTAVRLAETSAVAPEGHTHNH